VKLFIVGLLSTFADRPLNPQDPIVCIETTITPQLCEIADDSHPAPRRTDQSAALVGRM